MKDLHSHISPAIALSAVVVASTLTSGAIDLQGFGSAEVLINAGAVAGAGNVTVKLQHSHTTTSGDFVDVVAADLLGAFPAALVAATIYRVGYVGPRRYVRTVSTLNSGTSIAAAIMVLRGHPADSPIA